MVAGRRATLWSQRSMRAKVLGLLLIAGAVSCAGIVMVVVYVHDEIPTCSDYWSGSDHDRLIAVPIDDFLGEQTPRPVAATCNGSSPALLYVEASLPPGHELPHGWFDRTEIGPWSARYMADDSSAGRMVCYASSDEAASDIQVRLWAIGFVSVSVHANRSPCESGTQ